MKLVQKENRQLRIEDSRLAEFIARGYAEVMLVPTDRQQENGAPQRKKGKTS